MMCGAVDLTRSLAACMVRRVVRAVTPEPVKSWVIFDEWGKPW